MSITNVFEYGWKLGGKFFQAEKEQLTFTFFVEISQNNWFVFRPPWQGLSDLQNMQLKWPRQIKSGGVQRWRRKELTTFRSSRRMSWRLWQVDTTKYPAASLSAQKRLCLPLSCKHNFTHWSSSSPMQCFPSQPSRTDQVDHLLWRQLDEGGLPNRVVQRLCVSRKCWESLELTWWIREIIQRFVHQSFVVAERERPWGQREA